MLELGKSGSHGTERGTVPVLADGAVVATLRAANWKEAATAEVGDRHWAFRRQGNRELVGRWAQEPAESVRLRARQVSIWKNTWAAELEGTPVEVTAASWWKPPRCYRTGGRPLAESGTTGRWSPRPTLTVEPGLALDHAVFLLWFEFVLGRRTMTAGAAS
ncbi:hypothetical protein O2W15_17235 [Modestobacter sp. VKM Ac-2979]|uniref:hypothetical protein n=1 Tax=unclassified Modestobacter TaxID=2643866 RepID=UPI0022AB9A12|nr:MULTISPECIES: hypothetical protein [unclassified Modestobacter]MCZ2813178.1 hypothetical protein [Modestobacter sp. VKM Ac-2979]MCZ2842793.1 hypothetical protein [Modestobacter sp. VKM Ac-2980]